MRYLFYWFLSFFRTPPKAVLLEVKKTGKQEVGKPVAELLKRAKADTSKEGPSILKYDDHPHTLMEITLKSRKHK